MDRKVESSAVALGFFFFLHRQSNTYSKTRVVSFSILFSLGSYVFVVSFMSNHAETRH